MFSIKDKELIQYIRSFFPINGDLPEYHEQTNTILLVIKGDPEPHPLLMGYSKGILKITAWKTIPANNFSTVLLKHILSINQTLPLGGFYYSVGTGDFGYSAGIPIHGIPTKDFLTFVLSYVKDILDMCVPEIISCSSMLYYSEAWNINQTFH